MGGDDPKCVGVLLMSALDKANYWPRLSLCIDLRCAEPVAHAALVHEVGEVELRRDAQAVAREVGVFGRADERATGAGGDVDTRSRALTPRGRQDAGGPEVAAAVPGKHHVSRRYVFNR